jgi:prepilin-type N-terminal cleavage/methylation domain-containing protein
MTARSGFTLIEVLVSIVLTAVVALVVYGAVGAARDTQARIAHERKSLQSALAMRLLLGGALAGAQATFLAADTTFVLENRTNARGIPQDRVTLTTSGNLPPLSSGADWIVTLEASGQGLRLVGRPMGFRAPARLLALLPGVSGLSVRVRHLDLGGNWSDEWPSPEVLPEAVELVYWTESAPVGVPLTVSLAMGRVTP